MKNVHISSRRKDFFSVININLAKALQKDMQK